MGGGHAIAFAVHFCRREIVVLVFFLSLISLRRLNRVDCKGEARTLRAQLLHGRTYVSVSPPLSTA